MSLEAIAAGLVAMKGLSLIASLLRGPETQALASRLQSGESLSEAEFNALFQKLVEAAREREAEAKTTASPPSETEEMLATLVEKERALSPLLFRTLDADGNGELEGQELKHLERLVGQIQRALAQIPLTEAPSPVT
jgi:hypothetical protein